MQNVKRQLRIARVIRSLEKMMKKLTFAVLLLSFSVMAGEFNWVFQEGKWNPADWILVKSPRWSNIGAWVQKEDHIQNRVPEGATKEELQGKRNPETYASMVRKQMVTGKAKVSANMSFDYRMAPEIVIAGPLGADKDGYPEYREHWEIVLYDEGLNVWHHEIKDGKPFWRKAAFLNTKYEAGKVYKLEAEIVFTAKTPILTVRCDGKTFGCMLPTLPNDYYVGITACEGINKFYDFNLTTAK